VEYRLNIRDLSNPKDIAKLISAISEIASQLSVIENRTSDPSTPATGQIWIRTNL
jgi:hypothetical protein